jgi:hypothetical protein
VWICQHRNAPLSLCLSASPISATTCSPLRSVNSLTNNLSRFPRAIDTSIIRFISRPDRRCCLNNGAVWTAAAVWKCLCSQAFTPARIMSCRCQGAFCVFKWPVQHLTTIYRGADKSLARPTSRCILFDGENISFDASLFIYINSTNIPPILIINRIYETQNLLSL